MGSRIAREHTGMHGDARPCNPLHVGHRRATVDIGVVKFVFLNDAEDAHWRRMSAHARGDRRFREESAGVVKLQALPFDRDRDDQRSLRLGRFLLRRLDFFCLISAHSWPPLQDGRWLKIIITGIVTGPIISGSVGLGGGTGGTGQRQKGNLPKPSGPNPTPTHAYHLQILNHLLSVLQTRYAFTSVAVPGPVMLVQLYAKSL